MRLADLYVDSISIEGYLPEPDCGACAVGSCREFAALLRALRAEPEGCPRLGPNQRHAARVAARAAEIFPPIEVTQHPQVGETGVLELNGPGPDSPLLVSGNARQTVDAVTAILATTVLPVRVLFLDTRGDTVDMALVLGTMTAETVASGLEASAVSGRLGHRRLMVPGLAAPLAAELSTLSGFEVVVGPRCIGEVPLTFARDWAAGAG